ncbi:uncharacterized protein LOC107137837 isoform X1 [Marmota marmota marmota]|uniref:uncharacterized protein LOC107137837 isoform X1 n=1 Tax=Marmota marmota marmota TaxID=9994 RepID=UPI0007627EF7|nr:uncharacterized protein LOC107137837 isoform X1 [Marmota marmota marmota]
MHSHVGRGAERTRILSRQRTKVVGERSQEPSPLWGSQLLTKLQSSRHLAPGWPSLAASRQLPRSGVGGQGQLGTTKDPHLPPERTASCPELGSDASWSQQQMPDTQHFPDTNHIVLAGTLRKRCWPYPPSQYVKSTRHRRLRNPLTATQLILMPEARASDKMGSMVPVLEHLRMFIGQERLADYRPGGQSTKK